MEKQAPRKKRSIHETTTAAIIEDAALNEEATYTKLSKALAEIRKTKGVIGYILRNSTTATIDLQKTEKLVQYAILSSQALESSQQIAEQFKLGGVETVTIEGEDAKLLCINKAKIKIAIFMEPETDHNDIQKRIPF
ncbi:MAG: roadblock/LC7 domain-containing protein [Candidatus Bathyarchaeia archaeon]